MIEYGVLGQGLQNLPINRGEIRLCWMRFQISGKKHEWKYAQEVEKV